MRLVGIDQQIIYGEYGRLDVYEHPDPLLRQIAGSSAVALARKS